MLSFISAKEAAEKWKISPRRVSTLCSEKRIFGAMMVGNMWIIPSDAEKPTDKRIIYSEKKSAELKPFVKWVGGKGQLVSEIEKYIPSKGEKVLTKYCEPMVGGGALFFNILSNQKFNEFFICDINAELINAYKVVQNDVSGLIERLNEMQYSFLPLEEMDRKYFFYNIRDRFNNTSLTSETAKEKAALFIFLNKTCFNGLYRVNKNGQFNVPMGAYKNPTICDEENLLNVSKALQKTTIVCGDFTSCRKFVDKRTFVYIDPPYRPISKTARFTSYNVDSFNDVEQQRLAKFIDELNEKGASFVLSNSDPKNINTEDNFFDELYKDYTIRRVAATRMINSKGDSRGYINELIITNVKGENE